MTAFVELFGFPPHPFGIASLLFCALLWGTQARRRVRPHLLALQAAIIAGLMARILLFLSGDSLSLMGFFENIIGVTLGQVFMFWLFAWVIIIIIFAMRARSDSDNIFTRNRKS